jgi:hypothetical protein
MDFTIKTADIDNVTISVEDFINLLECKIIALKNSQLTDGGIYDNSIVELESNIGYLKSLK